MNSTQLTGRQKNVMAGTTSDVSTTAGTQGPEGPEGPQGPQGPQGAPGVYIGVFKVVYRTGIDLLAPAGTTNLIYTVPSQKTFVIQNHSFLITSVVGSEKTNFPEVSLSSDTNTLSYIFNFENISSPDPLAIGYSGRADMSTSNTLLPAAGPGQGISLVINSAFDGEGQDDPYTTLLATWIVAGYEMPQ